MGRDVQDGINAVDADHQVTGIAGILGRTLDPKYVTRAGPDLEVIRVRRSYRRVLQEASVVDRRRRSVAAVAFVLIDERIRPRFGRRTGLSR